MTTVLDRRSATSTDRPTSHLVGAAVLFAGVTVAVAVLGSLATSSGRPWYDELEKPVFNPPDATFGVVWTILYAMIAFAGWLITSSATASGQSSRTRASTSSRRLRRHVRAGPRGDGRASSRGDEAGRPDRLANWTPGPGVADIFRIMAPFQPEPPPSSPFDWGDEDTVNELLGDAFELELERHVSPLALASGEEYWELFSTSYGPTKTLAESIGDRREELRDAWISFFNENNKENGGIVHRREYLLVLGRRR